jgi:hypothetical protein
MGRAYRERARVVCRAADSLWRRLDVRFVGQVCVDAEAAGEADALNEVKIKINQHEDSGCY